MRNGRAPAAIAIVAATTALGCLSATRASHSAAKPPRLEFLGQAIVSSDTTFEGTIVGGLSSIAYDPALGVFYALSDDAGTRNPVRFYTLRIDVSGGDFQAKDIQFLRVTTLLAPDGKPYPPGSLDPEGLAFARNAGELIVTSEGIPSAGIAPWVRRYTRSGAYLGDLPLPDAYMPTGDGQGVRRNLGFESAAVAPEGRHLFVGLEGALAQDGPAATTNAGSAVRILRYDLANQRPDREYVYVTGPIAKAPSPPTAFAVNGLVELLPFGTENMLAMERSFSTGAAGTGNSVKIYAIALAGAADVLGKERLAGMLFGLQTIRKPLVLDLDTLGIPLDNIEGMAIGPDLPDGRRSLILVSDNNFSPSQFTQFLLFAID